MDILDEITPPTVKSVRTDGIENTESDDTTLFSEQKSLPTKKFEGPYALRRLASTTATRDEFTSYRSFQ
jgi:hypothetical protein